MNADNVGWKDMNVWSWGGDGTHNPTAAKWPGDNISSTVNVGGKLWYTLKYTMNSTDDYVNFVFNTNNGAQQTVNIQNINKTSYIEILNEKDGAGHYKIKDVTDQYASGINSATYERNNKVAKTKVISIDGKTIRRFNSQVSTNEAITGLPSGIYIVNGSKVVK